MSLEISESDVSDVSNLRVRNIPFFSIRVGEDEYFKIFQINEFLVFCLN